MLLLHMGSAKAHSWASDNSSLISVTENILSEYSNNGNAQLTNPWWFLGDDPQWRGLPMTSPQLIQGKLQEFRALGWHDHKDHAL